MSLYEEIRFKGIVKKEFRETFEPIATRGLWEESADPVFAFFCMNVHPEALPMRRAGIFERWAKNPWENSYNVETGEWIFQCGYNTRTTGALAYDFEKDVVPYCMACVEHYETWCEPIVDDDPWPTDTLLESYIDGEWVRVGRITDDEILIVLHLIERGKYQMGEEIPFTPQAAAEIARDNRRRLEAIRADSEEE